VACAGSGIQKAVSSMLLIGMVMVPLFMVSKEKDYDRDDLPMPEEWLLPDTFIWCRKCFENRLGGKVIEVFD
jgi:hypothetical protein